MVVSIAVKAEQKLPPDKACSACSLVSAAVASALLALRDDAATPTEATRLFSERVLRECDSWRNLAVSGEKGRRVYVDMASALGSERAAERSDVKLKHVRAGAKVSAEVKAECGRIVKRVAAHLDPVAFAASARWRADLDLSRWLCRNGTKPCAPPAGGAAALRERPTRGPDFCDGCSSLLEAIYRSIHAAAERTRRSIDAGNTEDHDFDVRAMLDTACTPIDTRPGELAASAGDGLRQACAALGASNKHVQDLANALSGEQPTAASVHALKQRVCAALDPGCTLLEPRAASAVPTECARCRVLVGDLHAAMGAQRRRPDFGSRAHVFGALSELCAEVPMRHAPDAAQLLEEQCDELLDSHERRLGEAVLLELASVQTASGTSGGAPGARDTAGAPRRPWPSRAALERAVCARVLPNSCARPVEPADGGGLDEAADDERLHAVWVEGKDEL